MPKILPSKLRLIRAEQGLTLRGAAKVTGVTKESLSELERGVRDPHPTTLHKLAQGYGVEITDLLDRTEGKVPSGKAEGSSEVFEEEGPSPDRALRLLLEELHTRGKALLNNLKASPDFDIGSVDDFLQSRQALMVLYREHVEDRPISPVTQAVKNLLDEISDEISELLEQEFAQLNETQHKSLSKFRGTRRDNERDTEQGADNLDARQAQ